MSKYCEDCVYEAIRHWCRNMDSKCDCSLDRAQGHEIAEKANKYDSLAAENAALKEELRKLKLDQNTAGRANDENKNELI